MEVAGKREMGHETSDSLKKLSSKHGAPQSVQLGDGCLPREPDDLASLGDAGWRESARFLKICPFHMRQLRSAAIG